MPGIYAITNQVTHKVYVGSSVNPKSRWARHLHDLRNGGHDNGYLQRAWDKYGEDSFSFTVLEETSAELLLEKEGKWIDAFCALKRTCGYNLTKPDRPMNGTNNPFFGKTHTQETRRKMSAAHKGSKKPWVKGAAKGEKHHNSKLTWKLVREIRARHQSGTKVSDMASDYEVNQMTLYKVVNGLRWKE